MKPRELSVFRGFLFFRKTFPAKKHDPSRGRAGTADFLRAHGIRLLRPVPADYFVNRRNCPIIPFSFSLSLISRIHLSGMEEKP